MSFAIEKYSQWIDEIPGAFVERSVNRPTVITITEAALADLIGVQRADAAIDAIKRYKERRRNGRN